MRDGGHVQKYGSNEDLAASRKVKELSVIDGRRAQNCTILLSKLKLSDEDIKLAVLTCDQREDLQKDMLEQMIKYIPTKEEVDLLSEHKHDIGRMARADKFLFEMSQIFHYEQRLQALFYKKKFHERLSEVQPKVEALLKASAEVLGSKRLRKTLEIILAFGNYMNKGARGNAYGFKLQSLSKIADTKSSSNREVTLMHFLIQVLEKSAPDVVNLPEDLTHVEAAARVNLGELEKDFASLRVGLKNLKRELELMTSRQAAGELESRDQFVPIMTDFVTVATFGFTEVDEMLSSAKKQFNSVVEMFGDDPRKQQPDLFFGLFTDFLETFRSARRDNINMRKKKQDEEKRRKKEEEREKEREKKRKATEKRGGGGKKGGERGEFDDLVSALRSGEVFEKDVSKFQKRNRQRRPTVDLERERVVSAVTTQI